MHKFAPAPRPVPAEVLQYTGVRRGTADGFRRLHAACKLRGVTIGGFVATALTFIGAAIEPAAKLCDSDAHDGTAPPPPTGNAAAHTAIAASARRISLGLSYDINWRDRLAEPQGMHARTYTQLRARACTHEHTHARIGARKASLSAFQCTHTHTLARTASTHARTHANGTQHTRARARERLAQCCRRSYGDAGIVRLYRGDVRAPYAG
jgi:hypothetical protein